MLPSLSAPANRPANAFTIPPRPAPRRPRIIQTAAGYVVCGVAAIVAQPIRPASQARGLAERIADNPADALAVLNGLAVAGVFDLRPTFGKVVA
jgi:hypothetical protein